MNILIAPNAFKGSLTSVEIAEIIASAVKAVFPNANCIQLPVADGGDGTAEVLYRQLGGKKLIHEVQDPIGRNIQAPLYITPHQTAIIELADASGLRLLQPNEYQALEASTYGTGQLLKAALAHGCTRIILGVGGSATNEVGMGILRALGVRFLAKNGRETQHWTEITHLDCTTIDSRIKHGELLIPCDVNNPLTGTSGAAAVFGPQKGASPAEVEILQKAHHQLADLIEKQFNRRIHDLPFAGAAGGTSGGLHGVLGAKLVKGSAFILDELGFDEQLQQADLVITGEGHMDAQSASGKAPFEVARRAKKFGKPVIAIAGGISLATNSNDYDAAISICNRPMQLATAIAEAKALLHAQTIQVMRLMKVGRTLQTAS
ncbi:MAG: glycerate kinase [Flammeovirgaceae bacterium]